MPTASIAACSNFAASSTDVPLKAHKLKEVESLSVSWAAMQSFEKDACILTMVGSILDCSGVTSTHLLEEASFGEGMSEGT